MSWLRDFVTGDPDGEYPDLRSKIDLDVDFGDWVECKNCNGDGCYDCNNNGSKFQPKSRWYRHPN
jgi:hypothetical protein